MNLEDLQDPEAYVAWKTRLEEDKEWARQTGAGPIAIYVHRWGRDPEHNLAAHLYNHRTPTSLMADFIGERADREEMAAWGVGEVEWFEAVAAAIGALSDS
jgi:hypothetical protein